MRDLTQIVRRCWRVVVNFVSRRANMPKNGSKPQRQGESSPVEHRFVIVKFRDDLALPPYADNLELFFEKTESPEWKRIATLAPGATFRKIYQKLPPEEIE